MGGGAREKQVLKGWSAAGQGYGTWRSDCEVGVGDDALRALHAGRCRFSAAGDGRWGEVLKLKVVNCNNYFLLCKFFGPPTELECSTMELPAALSVMACEISCMHIEVGYLMLRRVALR